MELIIHSNNSKFESLFSITKNHLIFYLGEGRTMAGKKLLTEKF